MRQKRLARMAIALFVFVLIWQVVGMSTREATLPAFLDVVVTSYEISTNPDPFGNTGLYHLYVSLVRVGIVTAVGLSIAIVLGIAMGVNKTVETVVSTWLPFWMTFPTLIVVFIAMIMLGFSGTSVVVAVIIAATPYAVANTWEGSKSIDIRLIEMANSFGASKFEIWRHIYLPFLSSYIFGSFRYLFSMAWKVVVLAETFGVRDGLGSQFRFYFTQGEMTILLGYLLLFILVMFVVQYGLIPVQDRLFEWKSVERV